MKFKEEDFEDVHCEECAYSAKEIANTKLQEWLDKVPIVYCHQYNNLWDCNETKCEGGTTWLSGGIKDTHKAKLVCIEEIK